MGVNRPLAGLHAEADTRRDFSPLHGAAKPCMRQARGAADIVQPGMQQNGIVSGPNSMKSKQNRLSGSGRGSAPNKAAKADLKADRAKAPSAGARGHVTLREVAVAAGVSPMSVSNFINARLGAMRPETRERIQVEIERLGYRPNSVARNLRLSRRLSIDMVIVDDASLYLADPFTTHVVAGLGNYLNRNGYGLQLQGMSAEAFRTSPLVRNIRSDGICVLLSGSEATRHAIISALLRLGQPIVALQETFNLRGADICNIRQADREGGGMVAREVLRRKARRVMMLVPEVTWPAIVERVAGARAVLLAADPAPEFHIVSCGTSEFGDTQKGLAVAIEAYGYPDAILAGNDQMGIAAMKLMATHGRRVPGDVAITGFNAFEFWKFTDPVLTTIRSPAYEMGARAGEELLARLANGVFERREIVYPVELQRGGSA
jgi:LacI family transcriptional regulator